MKTYLRIKIEKIKIYKVSLKLILSKKSYKMRRNHNKKIIKYNFVIKILSKKKKIQVNYLKKY